MAKLSRMLLGGVVGAGLAYLFSRKDVRRRLMGGGQAQLPAAPVKEPGAYTAPAVMEAAVAPVDLGARIEETRIQVEEQLQEPFAMPAVAVEPGEEIDIAEAPEALVEEIVITEEIVMVEEVVAVEPETAVEEPVADVEEPVAEVEEPVAEEIQAEETEAAEEISALGTPIEGEPTLDAEPVRETPAEAPAGPAPSEIDRDEMRRRIDETRARLKAKAFDAMVSGETFIEPEAGEHAAGKPEAGADIDKDLEEHIDRSLREED